MFVALKTSISKLSFSELVATIFIVLFVYTASLKLMQLESFTMVLKTSPLIGQYAKYFSTGIPLTELLTVALLFSPGTRKRGLVLSLLLMMVFTTYIAYMLLANSRLPCSCGGVIERLTWRGHLVFNLLLTIIAAIAVFQHKIFIAISRSNRKPETE